ncbi:MAG: hypothetical protein V7750_01695 [Sneathiella sp.]
MPYNYTINTEKNLLVVKHYELFADADLQSFRETVENAPHFNTTMDQLVDLSKVTRFELTMPYIEMFAKNPLTDQSSTIVIIATTDIAHGTARAFASYSGEASENIHICRNYSEAEKILNLNNLYDDS